MNANTWPAALLGGLLVAATPAALGWGPDGHHTIGALADGLIAGSNAATQVASLLGGLTLEQAAVWADCAKGIDPTQNFSYTSPGKYPECAIFETPAGEAEMADFVRRNNDNCVRKPTEEICHKQYHYSDLAIQRTAYALGTVGTRTDDVVAAVAAAAHVLSGDPAPAPFSFKSKREALLVLSHYVGDLHQPLHVGAVYLDANGGVVDPDAGTYDPATATRGGNQLIATSSSAKAGRNLHATWDSIPASLKVDRITPAWLAATRAVPRTAGDRFGWSAVWGTGTLLAAHDALAGLTYAPLAHGDWPVTLPTGYAARRAQIQKTQLTLGGARLAQLLQAIWP